ncbi:MAG TPA: NEW3 domain-containing protein, partial [Humisphaera sp.]
YQRSGTTELGQAEQVAPGRKRLVIELPELPAGFYRASIVMSSQGQSLGSQRLAFIQLADDAPPGKPDGRFGFVATDLPFEAWDELPRVLPMLSAGRVKLAVWGPQGDILETDPAKFDALLEKLGGLGITPTACLVDLPPDVARKAAEGGSGGVAGWQGGSVTNPATQPLGNSAASSNWPLLLRADPKAWQPQLSFLISRHANHLDRWQIGRDGSDAFVADRRMRRVYDDVYAQFRKLVRQPDLAMPWPAWYEIDGQAPATVALSLPAQMILPDQIPLYVADAAGDGLAPSRPAATTRTATTAPAPGSRPTNVSVSLGWLGASQYGRHEHLRDLAERVVRTLAADAGRIDLPLPVAVRTEQGVTVQEPGEELMVLRTIITTLGGATPRGRVPVADGVEAFLFDRGGLGVIALWDRGTRGGDRELILNLGSRPYAVDLWGNATPLHKLAAKPGHVTMTLGRTPTFLVDVDAQMALTKASVALDRPLIESSFQPHVRRLRFTNAYRTAIGGIVRLKPPPGWQLNPPTFNFTLNPGEQFDKEVTIEIPYNSVAGAKTIDAQFALQADGGGAFVVPITVNLGLSDVGMQTIALRDGDDVIVQQMVTNYGDKPIDYTAFAVYPGQTRQERLISGLAAGKTTVKRYKFTGVEFKAGAKVRAGVKEMVGTRILNDEVAVQ